MAELWEREDSLSLMLPLWNIGLILWQEGQQTQSPLGTGENPLQGRGRNTEKAVKAHETQGHSDYVSLTYCLNIRSPCQHHQANTCQVTVGASAGRIAILWKETVSEGQQK